MMNGGTYGGCTHIKIQNNLFAGNIKSSPSLYELDFSSGIDGHSDIIVRNNILFLRPKNKENKDINLYNTNRTYVTAYDNDIYYLDEAAQTINVSFLGESYTYKATVKEVAIPVVSALSVNDGILFSEHPKVFLNSKTSKGSATSYIASENPNFNNAQWKVYNNGLDFNLSPEEGLKTIYFKVKNIAGESAVVSTSVALKTAPVKLDAANRSHVIVQFSPNPVKSKMNVSVVETMPGSYQTNSAEDDTYSLSLHNLAGHIVEQTQLVGNEFSVDMSHLVNGMYLLKMIGKNNSFSKLIVKN